ncbi:MAG TPA: hypothetical protein VGT61_04140 [Thermomicrobiales bacterium]|jgi:putative NIF3 family GTP cyclohydrolase 1 type 2|nr:hypothetical protein [Thermomicrobiales bacterium]
MTMPGTTELAQIASDLVGMTEMPSDSAIYVEGTDFKRVMMGIDIAGAELLLGRQLGVDAVIAHHPAGGDARLNFHRVLDVQTEFLVRAGVPADIAERTIAPKIVAAQATAQIANFDHAPSIARLLKMPFLNVHLPLDEYGRRVMDRAIVDHLATVSGEGATPTVADVVAGLRKIPELRDARTDVTVPVGSADNPAGKVFVFHGAGTNGGASAARVMWDHGVDTVVYIHLAPAEADALRNMAQDGKNVVVSGHISSDMIGINRYVADLEARGVEVIRMSGL